MWSPVRKPRYTNWCASRTACLPLRVNSWGSSQAEINKPVWDYIRRTVEGNGMKINTHYFKRRLSQAISPRGKTCNPAWQQNYPFSGWANPISDPHTPTTTPVACRIRKNSWASSRCLRPVTSFTIGRVWSGDGQAVSSLYESRSLPLPC
jgi:hypothetical protein